ncbi:MAG TPA: histidine phosphatase family protein [Flavobacteriaceae bacterium]|nr:histidine phosphatase family protein [Flavobacteriaceae bacterium]MCB9213336.1 histidine phosphatase family protein [Alteromonas sp.]HPF10226.1 histidine phosphatase family protein [Flavobacteriaceae bacterium]HQU20672.1 histidine phosphatase family protein [Flavobacteriaceae bacterium]HQU64910.1 histidine phosphatase family protein [Flavobacteriaceae bacterium]
MKTLYMVRHAKSSWEFDVIDHKRPLKERGKNDATLVSQYVVNHFKRPDHIATSDAERALATAHYFQEVFKVEGAHFEITHNLYDFSGHKVMETVKGLPDDCDTVMIVGHNHAFTSIANMLGNKYIDNVPTCGFVQIEFGENQWGNITTGKTIATVFPRDLKK